MIKEVYKTFFFFFFKIPAFAQGKQFDMAHSMSTHGEDWLVSIMYRTAPNRDLLN